MTSAVAGPGRPDTVSPRTAAITITAHGDPATQGSKRHIGRGRMIEAAAGLPAWRRDVTDATTKAVAAAADGVTLPLDGPLVAEITITVPKPKSAPKRRVTWPQTRASGDLDKLMRAVLDAIDKGGAIADDSRVVEVTARKVYPHEGIDALAEPGVVVHLWRLGVDQ